MAYEGPVRGEWSLSEYADRFSWIETTSPRGHALPSEVAAPNICASVAGSNYERHDPRGLVGREKPNDRASLRLSVPG